MILPSHSSVGHRASRTPRILHANNHSTQHKKYSTGTPSGPSCGTITAPCNFRHTSTVQLNADQLASYSGRHWGSQETPLRFLNGRNQADNATFQSTSAQVELGKISLPTQWKGRKLEHLWKILQLGSCLPQFGGHDQHSYFR